MKPDKPGEWHSRSGYRVLVYEYVSGGSFFMDLNAPGGKTLRGGEPLSDIRDDDWLPAAPPAFPELPPKPKIFHCFTQQGWRSFTPHGHCVTPGNQGMTARFYAVKPHPDNDPEAVRLIEEARKNG